MLIILGVAFIVAAVVAVLSSKNCKIKTLTRLIFASHIIFLVKPKDLVILRGFICFASLCQLVMSLNVMHHLAMSFKTSYLMPFLEVWSC